MTTFGALGFLSPWVLAGLVAIPLLWWLLRAIPPSPKTQIFPGVRLLLGLEDPERQAAKTPWWLLLLRAVMIAAVIIGFAQPVLNPSARLVEAGEGPVLIVIDQGWASAPDWDERVALSEATLDEAAQSGRQVMLWLVAATPDTVPPPVAAAVARRQLEAARPQPVPADHAAMLAALEAERPEGLAQVLWLHDGLSYDDATATLIGRLAGLAPMRMIGPHMPARALTPPALADGRMVVDVLRADAAPAEAAVVAMATTPEGPERRIAVGRAEFETDADYARATFDLPPELIARVTRVVLAERASAGGAALADAAIRRVPVAVIDPATEGEVATLTSARRYLIEGLEPWADVTEASLAEALGRDPAAIFLADQGAFAPGERAALVEWVEAGGLLVRFAGPRLAAAIGEPVAGAAAPGEDPLLPVTLRRGGRVLGGALAWGAPRTLGPLDARGPFRRLVVPSEVDVRTQVLAEPSPDLVGKVWATLDDGTPLVTASQLGEGRVVLFHVSADPEWSSLPISGLFVEMLGRLVALAPGQAATVPSAEELQGTQWRLERVIGPEGEPLSAPGGLDPVPGESLAGGRAGPGLPPGLYARADAGPRAAGAAESLALNLHLGGDRLAPMPSAPAGVVSETLGGAETRDLAPAFLMLAIVLAALDTLATLWLSGRLPGFGPSTRQSVAAVLAVVALGISPGLPGSGHARAEGVASEAPRPQPGPNDVSVAAETTLGYVLTGDARLDQLSERAMVGLGDELMRRTAVEPGPPRGVDPETDELSLIPVIYFPLTESVQPSEAALERLAHYISHGGMLVIDTQNGVSGFGAASAAEMRQIARSLNLPPLAPVDGDHVLSRTFYLLNDFPGRWRGGRVWAEAPRPGSRPTVEDGDLPQFDRVDDDVSPVIVGSADWAAAWAVDESGRPLVPVGRAGDRQREMAMRFGINVVMYALTGNYKSDQVHAPAVLERLGQ
ncbi:DUF4159 domain-containing protein [Limibaculum sp. M0105]|uniref:DUF4159 domain-containing protein n=1 Tax=Thermohalobaculum xanthum TaxID=2753746 RepID=A0A8J7M864_9RHOB|nr:DUF4159 domain-containing protein [Thermohalobaculum xanthum]MBK0400369.1 DUF4159 domain-containing protein [Thermohalobaculum xanthum]